MRKIIFMFALILFLNSVSAGEMNRIDMGDDGTTTYLNLKVGDGIRFYYAGGEHVITLDKVHAKGADLNIFLYVDKDQKTTYATAGLKRSIKLDLDRDGVGDFFISFDGYLIEGGAKLSIFNPVEEIKAIDDISGRVVVEFPEKNGNLNWFFGVVTGILVFTLLTALILNKKRKSAEI